jgi:uncharacterized protein YcfJ
VTAVSLRQLLASISPQSVCSDIKINEPAHVRDSSRVKGSVRLAVAASVAYDYLNFIDVD